MEKENTLGTAPIGKLLVHFAVPCVLSMLVSALYNIVDQIFIGWGVGYLGNAATNVVYPFTVLALAVALMIGDGSAALFSLSQGAGDHETARRSVGSGIVLALIASVVLTAAGLLLRDPLLHLFGVTDSCYNYAVEYMTVITAGIPFYIVTSAMNGVIRADGSPRYAMISTVVGAVLNLILDPVAIFALNMGVRGAALATIIGQIVTCILSALYFRKPKTFALDRRSFVLSGKISGRVLQLGVTSLVIQVAIVIVMSVANNMVGRYGPESVYGADIPLSVVGIVMKVFGIVIAFAVGIAVGGQPIVGYNYGAGNFSRVQETAKKILLADVVVGMIALLLFELCPQVIVRLFGSESDLYNQYANLCFRIFLSGIVFTCVQKAGSIFLQSIGKPVQSTLLSLSRDVIFFVPGLLLLTPAFGVEGMLWAAPVADVLAYAVTVLLVGRELKKMNPAEEKIPLSTHKEEL